MEVTWAVPGPEGDWRNTRSTAVLEEDRVPSVGPVVGLDPNPDVRGWQCAEGAKLTRGVRSIEPFIQVMVDTA